ncbi:CsiV family protein [Parendozoicomonas sp. Alg238-R29]|uniref:CsiV family protein n=1 Tax=Parendozoicomonas sp. Alg238-R29 TaxID=2993446 RepID=UPI00248E2156|nr:CsiV family protein [Parendozoicomonas sp. Alg238-R29]
MAALSPMLQAQEEVAIIDAEIQEKPSWYQFDVLVFRQKSQQDQEKLPPATPHNLPLDSVVLYNEKQLTIPAAFLPQPTPPEVLIPEPAVAGLTNDDATLAVPDDYLGQPVPAAAPVLQSEHLPSLEPVEPITDRKPDLNQDAFVLLPKDQSQLGKAAGILRRSRDYRPLWQSSWRMPLVKEGEPVSIYIAAGQQSGSSREIEGVLQLSLKRFVHADTELWVNTLNPVRPMTQILAGAPFLVSPFKQPEITDIVLPGPLQAKVEVKPQQLLWPENILNYSASMPLKSSKRLTPGKLVYIDSPQAGLLIRVTPWEKPELEEVITAELEELSGSEEAAPVTVN